jgi:spore germination protein KA
MANFSPEGIYDLKVVSQQLRDQLESWTAVLQRAPVSDPQSYVGDVQATYDRIKAGIGRNSDVVVRKIQVPACPSGPVLLVCLDDIVETHTIEQNIVDPLFKTSLPADQWDEGAIDPMDVSRATQWPDILEKLASGNTLIFAPNLTFAWVVGTSKFPQRSVTRPQTELAVRGPEEAFNEMLTTQKGQIRHRVHSPDLLFLDFKVGTIQKSAVAVAYIEGIANPALVTTVVERIKSIDVDGVVNMGQIAGIIRDHPLSIFPTARQTERLDIAVFRLMQGAVLVMLDGDPFVLIAPSPLIDFYRTAMDYSSSWVDTSFVRAIRFIGWIFGIYLPALYVGIAAVNPSILPGSLFVVMQAANIGMAFPGVIQILLMILIIETLREAALRLPKNLSTTIGTVGAIVVGTAVVKAGLINTQIVIIMTLTALSIFSTPVYELTGTWRVLGWMMLMVSFVLGIVGMVLITMAVIAVLVDMKSFGTPYFEPWAPFRAGDWRDAVWRMPWTRIRQRWSGPRAQNPRWRTAKTVRTRPRLKKGKMGW